MADYSFNVFGSIVRNKDGATIPIDNRNRDYQEYTKWVAVGNQADLYVAPKTQVPSISDRQFFQQLAIAKIITEDEAIAAVAVGAIPQAMAALIAALPKDNQFPAKMLIQGATVFNRSHPLTETLGSAFNMTDDQMDAFWTTAAAL